MLTGQNKNKSVGLYNKKILSQLIFTILTSSSCAVMSANVAAQENERVEEMIVTGTPGGAGVAKLSAGFSISTMSGEDIDRFAPKSTADLMKSVPGVWVESSGGVSGANIQFRGLPAPGDAPFVTVSINGSPVYGAPSLSFFESSTLFRMDETIERMEGLRGGPNAVFASGQPGLTTNFILKEGEEDTQGVIKYSTSDYDLDRVDAMLSGQLDDDLFYMIGGYVKSSPGIRDTEYTSEKGKQFTLNLTKILDNGKVNAYTRITDDRGAFYVAIPLGDNQDGIPGFDAGTGTYHSNDLRFASIASHVNPHTGDVQFRDFDLADGRGWDGVMSGLNAEFDLENGWMVRNNLGVTEGDANTIALFNGDTNTLASLVGAGATGTVISSGETLDDSDLVSSVGFWTVEKHFQSFSNDLSFSYETDNNNLTVGLYVDQFSAKDTWSLGNNFYITAEANGQRVEVVDGFGGEVTSGGQYSGAFFAMRQNGDARTQAIYIADTFHFDETLAVDVGVRAVDYSVNMTFDNPIEVDVDGDPSTQYDVGSVVDGVVDRTESHDVDDISFTAGVNWNYSDDQGVFARITQGFLLPTFETVRNTANQQEGIDPSERELDQAEFGYKMMNDSWDLYATLFFNSFSDAQFQIIDDEARVTKTESETLGLELEGSYSLENFTIGASMTWLDAEITDSSDATIEGNQPQRIPELQFRLSPSYDLPLGDNRLSVYGSLSWVDDRYSDLQNEQILDSYTKLDIGAQYFLGEHVDFKVAIDNATDEVGLTEGDARTAGAQVGVLKGRPIFGRTIVFSVGYSF
ncbi:Vitamin B12 transporter BtuB [Thalassocella blandensis]|nr:Vitamin B12 transporter BtuB [Thalassocella blandensis]